MYGGDVPAEPPLLLLLLLPYAALPPMKAALLRVPLPLLPSIGWPNGCHGAGGPVQERHPGERQ
jgi:hypothetical protein